MEHYQRIPLVPKGLEINESSKELQNGFKVYKRRWYCLFLYTLICFCFSFVSSSMSAVQHAAMVAFNWTNFNIALSAFWLNAMFILTFSFASWLLDTKGPRVAFLFGTGFLAVGSGIRCLSADPPDCNWTFAVGQILIGIANPTVNGGASCFSNAWFPPHQRTLATACSCMGLYFGIAFGAIIGPIIVPVRHANFQHVLSSRDQSSNFSTISSEGAPLHVLKMREDIMLYLLIQFGTAAALFLMILIYFPSKAPTPPSVSATYDRVDFKSGVMVMIQQPMFLLMMTLSVLTAGVNGAVGTELAVGLLEAGVPKDQVMAGWMFLGSVLGGAIFSFIIGSLVEKFKIVSKYIMTAWLSIGFFSLMYFALQLQRTIKLHIASLYFSFILGQTTILSLIPVFFELTCDVTFPVGEGLTAGALNFGSNLATAILLLLLMLPHNVFWINSVSAASLGLCIPLTMLFKRGEDRT